MTQGVGARVLAGVLLGVSLVGSADAGRYHRHGHWRGTSVGVVVGVPLGWPYYAGGFYDWPYDAPARTVVVEREPTVYVERGASGDGGSGEGWWHYCRSPEGYYPYVRQCPGGWERVAPDPSD